ncbi:MAG: gliding motility lipoprotein GldD [Dysgonamonadaceae bacterium]|jgi:gliding motility-associated lipoprotein GldD|nr:gliding motility lipoprotein GldD [Dysgonamonadaceae bacterium]
MKCFRFVFCVFALSFFSACQEYSPKPEGYFRIDLPTQSYGAEMQFKNFQFDLSNQAETKIKEENKSEILFNIAYDRLNADIFCSYIPLKSKNLAQLSEECRKFVYLHVLKADAIEESFYENSDKKVYALVYKIKGNVASPTQFVLTDSVNSFLRGALYFNNAPNQDSIAPVLEYLDEDIQILIESFQWK